MIQHLKSIPINTLSARISIRICIPKSLIICEKYNMPLTRLATPALVAALLALVTLVNLPAVMAQTNPLPAKAANSDYQDAVALFRQGQLDRAMERIDAWLKSRPKDARGRFLRGMILTQQKKTGEARAEPRTVLYAGTAGAFVDARLITNARLNPIAGLIARQPDVPYQA